MTSPMNGEFATAFFCITDPKDGKLTWTRCGHNPPLLRRRDGTIEQIESAATLPLGITDDIEFEADSCTMHPGDTLILYTDGITEATANRPAHEFSMHKSERNLNYFTYSISHAYTCARLIFPCTSLSGI